MRALLKIGNGGGWHSRLYTNIAVQTGQKIAVRVVSQFGEETTKVLEVK